MSRKRPSWLLALAFVAAAALAQHYDAHLPEPRRSAPPVRAHHRAHKKVASQHQPAAPVAGELTIQRVVDGDTLLLSDGRRVRLIGIDTPEVHRSAKLERDAQRTHRDAATIQALGQTAKRFTEEMAQGRPARLEYDTANAAKNNLDKYGRTLAYVYVTPPECDEVEEWVARDVCELDSYQEGFLNALIVEAGYGNAYTSYPFRDADHFRQLEKDARDNERGLWRTAAGSVL